MARRLTRWPSKTTAGNVRARSFQSAFEDSVTLLQRLKGIAIAMTILVACFPLAAVATMLLSPAWSWFEARTGVEAYGHSGPAEWCYLVAYGLLIGICSLVWTRTNRAKPAN